VKKLIILLALFVISVQSTYAIEIPEQIKSLVPKVDSIVFNKDIRMYEVVAGRNVFYLSEDLKYVFVGNIVRVVDMKNITEEKTSELNRIEWSRINFENAIRLSQGKHSIAVFSDPDCPYCRKLHKELKKLKDVSVYVFLSPLKKIHPESEVKAISIWCSEDRIKALDNAYNDVKIEHKECENPINKNLEFMFGNNIYVTPTIVLESGEIVEGYLPSEKLQTLIEKEEKK
jgi:thiol:disulfide interchange protein DsbC